MRKSVFIKSFVVAAAIAATMIVSAQGPGDGKGKGKGDGKGDGKAKGPAPLQALTVAQLKPGLFLITGDGGNTSVRVTKDGLIVTDTKNLGDPNYAQLAAKIKEISPLPVKFAIITHHHQDHSGNGGKFMEAGAKVIANNNLIKNLDTYAPAQGKPGKPNVGYDKDYKLKLGEAKVEIHHYMPAHTSGDSIVYFPDLRVIQCGDVVVGTAPNVDFPFGGSAVHWLETLDKIEKLKWDILIPGHSAPNATTMTRADFMDYKKKWTTLVTRAKEQVAMGTPKDKLLAAIKTDDIGWNVTTAQWNPPARLDPFYAELQAATAKKK